MPFERQTLRPTERPTERPEKANCSVKKFDASRKAFRMCVYGASKFRDHLRVHPIDTPVDSLSIG